MSIFAPSLRLCSALRGAWLLSVLACGCSKEEPQATPAPSQSAAPLTAASATTPASMGTDSKEAASETWFVGKWQGTYEAKPVKIELAEKAANEKAWAKDDGTKRTGGGTLSLEVSKEGIATGTTGGALGDGEVSGAAESDRIVLSFAAKDRTEPLAMAGTLVLKHEAGTLSGSLKASSTDSYVVREATVSLKKTP